MNLYSPFPFESHKWRVMNATKDKTKGTVAYYIDARDVMDRLDQVIGADSWFDHYQLLASGEQWVVQCDLTINGVTKSDVGEGDAAKDAYSDALKRAAVKFGVFRYGYSLDTKSMNFGWFPLDEYRNFTKESQGKIAQMLKQQLKRIGVDVPDEGNEAVYGSGTTDDVFVVADSNGVNVVDNPFDDDTEVAVTRLADEKTLKKLHAVGQTAYEGEWDAKRKEMVVAVGSKAGRDITSSKQLQESEAEFLISGIEKKLRQMALGWKDTLGMADAEFGVLVQASTAYGDWVGVTDLEKAKHYGLVKLVKALVKMMNDEYDGISMDTAEEIPF